MKEKNNIKSVLNVLPCAGNALHCVSASSDLMPKTSYEISTITSVLRL